MEAAERRIAEQQSRGIKNIEAVKRQERLDQLREKRQEEVGNRNVQSNLKVRRLILENNVTFKNKILVVNIFDNFATFI